MNIYPQEQEYWSKGNIYICLAAKYKKTDRSIYRAISNEIENMKMKKKLAATCKQGYICRSARNAIEKKRKPGKS